MSGTRNEPKTIALFIILILSTSLGFLFGEVLTDLVTLSPKPSQKVMENPNINIRFGANFISPSLVPVLKQIYGTKAFRQNPHGSSHLFVNPDGNMFQSRWGFSPCFDNGW